MRAMDAQPRRVTVDGAIHGDYVVEEQRPDGSVLLRPAAYPSVFPQYPGRPATDAEFTAFLAEHHEQLLPSDDEG
jgi:hypothetical protein